MRSSRGYFVIWLILLCLVVNILILLVWAMRMGPNESNYNNDLENVLALPFLGLGALVLIILLCCFPRSFKWQTAIIVVSVYTVASLTAYLNPTLYGGYRATFRILDRAGKPIPGIRVDFLQQRALYPGGPICVFFVQDYADSDYSDSQGLVHTTANIFTDLYGMVNKNPQEIKPLNPEYKRAGFTVMWQPLGYIYSINWILPAFGAKKGDYWSEKVQVPFRQPLTVYLGSKNDDGSYPGN